MINFGKYDQQIVIQSYTQTRNVDGSVNRSWSELYSVWAKVVPKGGNETEQSDEKVANTVIYVEVRATGLNINETMRIVWRNVTYNITNMQRFGTRLNEGISMTAIAKDND